MTVQPEAGYVLRNWRETWSGLIGRCIVSSEDQYSFRAQRDRNLSATMGLKAMHVPLWLLLIAD